MRVVKILGVLLGVPVLLITGIFIYAGMLDMGRYEQLFAVQVKRATGRDLVDAEQRLGKKPGGLFGN